ncbi:HTH domain-containing protein [Belliella kenyensis]|uniref:HTH domain-containing protein n=1 Tax=Belliella kenyensis TaxID=1472724 RepID=A0ABV8ENN4_9BACT|nr:helix-turn-helix domain-containing protein [Belliella kenyensis]MCH7400788.1 helix-turn-helix domain-containing protein [Belliella kenyensis]MDN3601924.1 helix-turn-helix domain-containing protein [Belliella kenyensis]
MPANYFLRLEYLDELIRKKATGSPKQLAKKFDVSERTIYDYINILRELDAEIFYCSICESYMYKKHGLIDFKFRPNN